MRQKSWQAVSTMTSVQHLASNYSHTLLLYWPEAACYLLCVNLNFECGIFSQKRILWRTIIIDFGTCARSHAGQSCSCGLLRVLRASSWSSWVVQLVVVVPAVSQGEGEQEVVVVVVVTCGVAGSGEQARVAAVASPRIGSRIGSSCCWEPCNGGGS